ncbi:MAG TPA: sigma 54-interacting transcriptional regulator [Labilithrix sp.]|jgi:Nif-specific regulatory protein|nr:sigma 54-interacting transcriptional regulator [Labilithrix sp.]
MDVASLIAERDLYKKLLDLGENENVESFLKEALSLSLQASSALSGYIELRDETNPSAEGLWWIAEGFSDAGVEATRAAISRGVIAEALATGHTIVTASALDDPRFANRESVKSNRIEAVLCAPIGRDPPFGVIYLQDRREAGSFTEDDRLRAERLSRRLAPLAERLILRMRADGADDPTRVYRASLSLPDFVGRSQAMARVLRDVAATAPRRVTVLLTGPSGTGKTQLARIIHDNSPRRSGPFVELNCATLPEALMESELFGAMPGSHSTAMHRTQGKVEAAAGGTLFLDEIAELSLGAQSKLLQLLQSLEYFPLGATKPLRADVRLIVATNADLEAAVGRRTFREDLLYRIQIVPINVPGLAARTEDIRDLVALFCKRACETHEVGPLTISPAAFRAAEVAAWPGNVRQLENAVEAAVIRAAAEGSTRLEVHHLFVEQAPADPAVPETFQSATRRFQAQFVLRTLEDTGWNIVETARRLDLTRSHVYNLIRAHGFERSRKSGEP